MSKHTLGPWRVRKDLIDNVGWVVLYKEPGVKGESYRRLGYFGSFTEADARLMAAAPDLLELAKKFSSYVGPGTLQDEIDNVIARATESVDDVCA